MSLARDKDVAVSPDLFSAGPGTALLVTRNSRQQSWGKRWLSRAGFDVKGAVNVDDTLRHLADMRPSVVIVDARMRDITGRSLYELVLEKRRNNACVFVLCKSARDRDDVARHEQAEILRKPFDWRLISRRVLRAAEMHNMQQELLHARKALTAARMDATSAQRHVLAMRGIDTLTGLPGRERFISNIARLRKGAAENSSPAVLVLGIDRFDLINDTVGHAVGNQVLHQFAERLHALLEKDDLLSVSDTTTLTATAGRVAGVRFGLLLSITNVDEIQRIANVIDSCFERPFESDGQSIYLSITMGAACMNDDRAPACNLLGLAEQALEEARADNVRLKFFDPSSANQRARSLMIEDMLHTALPRGQLNLAYQPIMDFHGRSVVAAEALLRWSHPEIGEISPDEFMPVAERTDLVADINEFVIEEVIRQAAEWAETVDGPNRIAVNLSYAQLMAGNIVELMQQSLARHSVTADQLQIEVRESDLLNRSEGVFDVIHQLKGLGVKLAIDQFGTGAFSIALLEQLPLDTVKIERTRVNTPRRDRRSDAIGSGIVAIARRLDLSVTAVGIESDTQIQRLRNWGCNEFQGNFFSPPVAASQLTADAIPGMKERFRSAAALRSTGRNVFAPDMRHESRPLTA